MDTAFQPDAFQPDAFQIYGGSDGDEPETAFQMDAFQADAFQIYGGPDGIAPPAVTGGRHAVRYIYPHPAALEDDEFILLI